MTKIMNQRRSFTRRTMLRGLGVSMALPWMESLRAWGDDVPGSLNKNEAPCAWPFYLRAMAFTKNGGLMALGQN